MKQVVLVRHIGSTRASENNFGRRYDADIDEKKKNQIDDVRSYLSETVPCKILSSPARRCLSTARVVYPTELVGIVPEFIPYHSGLFEKKEESWVRENYSKYYHSAFGDRFLQPKHGEESISDQYRRCKPAIIREFENADFELCIVVVVK